MIYFHSDTHFCHTNIIKYCNRPFKSIDEMNKTLINNWNSVVDSDDTVYFLGDFCLGSKDNIINIFNQLNGNKILVRGNHDRGTVAFYERVGFKVLTNAPIKIDEYKILLSHAPVPDNVIPHGYINIHGHIHNKKICDNYPDYNSDIHFNVSSDAILFKPITLNKILRR